MSSPGAAQRARPIDDAPRGSGVDRSQVTGATNGAGLRADSLGPGAL
jgi:hypothetical protein